MCLPSDFPAKTLYRLVTVARPTTRSLYLILFDFITLIVFDAPQGLTIFVSSGSGVPEIPNASGLAYRRVTLFPGVINTDAWSFRSRNLKIGWPGPDIGLRRRKLCCC